MTRDRYSELVRQPISSLLKIAEEYGIVFHRKPGASQNELHERVELTIAIMCEEAPDPTDEQLEFDADYLDAEAPLELPEEDDEEELDRLYE